MSTIQKDFKKAILEAENMCNVIYKKISEREQEKANMELKISELKKAAENHRDSGNIDEYINTKREIEYRTDLLSVYDADLTEQEKKSFIACTNKIHELQMDIEAELKEKVLRYVDSIIALEKEYSELLSGAKSCVDDIEKYCEGTSVNIKKYSYGLIFDYINEDILSRNYGILTDKVFDILNNKWLDKSK